MADNAQPSHPYVDASGKNIDLAFNDHIIARVCHYIMLHCTKSLFLGNPPKKQYGLKAGLKKIAEQGNKALMKELC